MNAKACITVEVKVFNVDLIHFTSKMSSPSQELPKEMINTVTGRCPTRTVIEMKDFIYDIFLV